MPLGGITRAWYLRNMKDNIVITGIGVVSSLGIGKEAFWQALKEGKSGVRPVTLFDTAHFKTKLGAQVPDFKAEEILGPKGLRTFDRTIKLLLCAGTLAVEDAGLEINEEVALDMGVSIGNAFGSVWSSSEFDKTALREGPRYVNPAEFPNTVMNSPASQLAIRFKIKGPCATISNEFVSSTDSLKYAIDLLKNKRAKIVLTGGVEELCEQTYLAFYKTRFLAGLKGEEISCPFDQRRNGIILGEGSALFVLESEESALKRKAHIYARVSGYGTYFQPYKIDNYEPTGFGLKKAIGLALAEAAIKPDAVSYICSAANSTLAADAIETKVLKEVFGQEAAKIPVTSIKSMTGETFSASGAMQVASCLGALEKGFIPPTINYAQKDVACDLNYVANVARNASPGNILINTFGPANLNSCLVISRHKDSVNYSVRF